MFICFEISSDVVETVTSSKTPRPQSKFVHFAKFFLLHIVITIYINFFKFLAFSQHILVVS